MLQKILILCVGLFVLCETAGVNKGATCPSVKLKFGRTRYRQRGRFAKFVCNTGYLIAGEQYSTCVNGTWDGQIPKCVRPTCKKVTAPVNGLIYPSHRGAVLNFFCKPGFDLHGTPTIYCDGNTWDNSLPSCIPANTKPLLSCDFESLHLCGWNQDLRHDFDWTRMNYKTPSGHLGTGPSFDHTLGEGKDGYYMYIESSSRRINDTARLISPIFNQMNDDTCLEFFYHMHGASTGQLRVYLKRLSDPWLFYPENAIFWKMGNHGDKWLHSFIHMGPITEDFQIIFEGVRGSSFYSDIAIDDISIIPNCITKYVTTERDDISTVDYVPTQSCLNRCDGNKTISTNANLQSCGCDETCTDSNTCCPDYIALCVVGVTDYNYVTTDTTISQLQTLFVTTIKVARNVSTTSTRVVKPTTDASHFTTLPIEDPVLNTLAPKRVTATPNLPTKPSSTTINEITSGKPTNVTEKSLPTPIKPIVNVPIVPAKSPSTNNTTKLPQPTNSTNTTKPPEKSSNLPSVSTKPVAPVKPLITPVKPPIAPENTPNIPVQPPIASVKPPVAPENIPKVPVKPPLVKPPIVSEKTPIIPVKPTNVSEKMPKLPTNQPSAPKVPTFTKYVAKQSSPATTIKAPTTLPVIDEIITVPVRQTNKENEDSSVEPVVYKDKEVEAASNIQNQKIIKEARTNGTIIVVVAVLSVSVVLMVIIGTIMFKRYRYTCSRSRIRGSRSESQSEVRFLTSDEVLDFSLAYSDG